MLNKAVFALMSAMVTCGGITARAAPILGQKDDFKNSSSAGWDNGSANPNPATVIQTGGPAGTGDAYLRVSSKGGGGAGSKLVVFNSTQWAGNYSLAGVDTIQMSVKNFGSSTVALRLIVEDERDSLSLTSANALSLPAGGGWTTATFSLKAADVRGGNYGTVMSRVTELNLVHAPNFISTRSASPAISAQIGIDNIVAIPEPGAIAWVFGTMVLVGRRTRRDG